MSDAQAQEEEEMEQKIINEGNSTAPSLNPTGTDHLDRVQGLEEERQLPLRLNTQHSLRLANSYNSVATRQTNVGTSL